MATLTDHGTNGTVPLTAREKIAVEIEVEIERCEQRRAEREHRRAEIASQIAEIDNEIKAFRQAAQRLRGEPLISKPATKRGPRGPYKSERSANGELTARIRSAVMLFARDHDEFRQIDIRSMPGAELKSSQTAIAFEQLRQDGVLRLARKEGNNKYYRLTSEGQRQRDEATS